MTTYLMIGGSTKNLLPWRTKYCRLLGPFLQAHKQSELSRVLILSTLSKPKRVRYGSVGAMNLNGSDVVRVDVFGFFKIR
jgi:hypothetical protein